MKNKIYEVIKQAIMSHKRWKGKDIYAVMIIIDWNVMGDVLDILINCNRDEFKNMGPLNFEERWDYSYWGDRNEINIVPDLINDRNIVKWLYEMGVEHIGEERENSRMVQGGEEVLELMCEVASDLLNDEDIISRIGKNTPILIHELDYFEPYIRRNLELNQGKRIGSYIKWMKQINAFDDK